MEKYLEQLTNQIGGALNYSAHQAGFVLGHLWVVLVRQEFAQGILYTALGVLYVILAVVVLRIMRGFQKKKWDNWDKNALSAFCILVALFLIMQGLALTSTWVLHIVNPEYYALQDATQILHQTIR